MKSIAYANNQFDMTAKITITVTLDNNQLIDVIYFLLLNIM